MPRKKTITKKQNPRRKNKITRKKRGIKPGYYFMLCSGGIIKNVKELALTLDYLSDEEFNHHVNHERNDFSNWIKDVFKEKELAEHLAATQDKKDSQIIMLKHLINKRQR